MHEYSEKAHAYPGKKSMPATQNDERSTVHIKIPSAQKKAPGALSRVAAVNKTGTTLNSSTSPPVAYLYICTASCKDSGVNPG